jgi:hypothetical protein
MSEEKCLLCGQINAPVWVSQFHLAAPGIALLVVAKQELLNLAAFKDLCQELFRTGVNFLRVEAGLELTGQEVEGPKLHLVK